MFNRTSAAHVSLFFIIQLSKEQTSFDAVSGLAAFLPGTQSVYRSRGPLLNSVNRVSRRKLHREANSGAASGLAALVVEGVCIVATTFKLSALTFFQLCGIFCDKPQNTNKTLRSLLPNSVHLQTRGGAAPAFNPGAKSPDRRKLADAETPPNHAGSNLRKYLATQIFRRQGTIRR